MRKSYLNVFDSSHVYELIKRSFQLCQDDRSLVEYHNELNSIFMKFHYHGANNVICTIDIEKVRKHSIKDRF